MDHADQPAGGFLKPRVGDRLRSAREARSLSLEDVSSHTRVPKRLLEFLEAGDHASLPAPTYSAGFVKSYAQHVGLDGVELSRQFREELNHSGEVRRAPEPFEPADPARVPSRFLVLVALVVAVLIGGGYALWRSNALGGTSEQRAELAAGTDAAAPAPELAPPAAAAPAADPLVAPPAAAAGPVVLTATDVAWVKVYERSGKIFFHGEMSAGQRFEVPADAVDPLIRTGRPEALTITVGDRQIPQLGAPNTLVRDVSLGRDALLARAAAAPPPTAPAATPPPAAGL